MNDEMLEEIESDVQRLVDCVEASETVILSRGILINSTTTIRIERPIHITAEDSDGEDLPRWTCGVSEARDQILSVR